MGQTIDEKTRLSDRPEQYSVQGHIFREAFGRSSYIAVLIPLTPRQGLMLIEAETKSTWRSWHQFLPELGSLETPTCETLPEIG